MLLTRQLRIPFTPASLVTAAWFDPSDISTLFQDSAGTIPVTASGQSVGMMKDKSGNGNHVTQATVANQPIYTVDSSGAYLLFNGTSSYLFKTPFSAVALPWDRLTALQQISWTINHWIWFSLTQSVGLTQNAATPQLRLESGTTTNALQNGGAALGSNVVVVERHIANASKLAVNGTYVGPVDAGAVAPTSLYLGSTTSVYANFRFYGAVMGAQFTTAQIANLQTWLGARCGITL